MPLLNAISRSSFLPFFLPFFLIFFLSFNYTLPFFIKAASERVHALPPPLPRRGQIALPACSARAQGAAGSRQSLALPAKPPLVGAVGVAWPYQKGHTSLFSNSGGFA